MGMKLFSTQSQLHKEIHQQMQCSLNLIKYNPATKPVGITGHVVRLKKRDHHKFHSVLRFNQKALI
jgi:hypothetical protein